MRLRGAMLNFSFAPGFSEHTIHVRGSLASATLDFERNTYHLHHHTSAGLDFDRYHMSIAEAKTLKSQARGTLARTIYSKLRPTWAAVPMARASRGQCNRSTPTEVARSILVSRPSSARDVVRTCVAICQQVTGARYRDCTRLMASTRCPPRCDRVPARRFWFWARLASSARS